MTVSRSIVGGGRGRGFYETSYNSGCGSVQGPQYHRTNAPCRTRLVNNVPCATNKTVALVHDPMTRGGTLVTTSQPVPSFTSASSMHPSCAPSVAIQQLPQHPVHVTTTTTTTQDVHYAAPLQPPQVVHHVHHVQQQPMQQIFVQPQQATRQYDRLYSQPCSNTRQTWQSTPNYY